jgi:hypothetical protein
MTFSQVVVSPEKWLVETPINIAAESHVLPIPHVARLAIPLNQEVDDVASEIERFVLKVVASACLQVRIRREATRETIALTSSHITKELAFSAWLSVGYADEFGPAFDVYGGTRAEHENCCNQIGDFHIDILDSLLASKTHD